MAKANNDLTSIFSNSMFNNIEKAIDNDAQKDTQEKPKKLGDLFSNILSQPDNITSSSESESYPAMQGLTQPTHLNNPERTTGNGRGGVIASKTINKSASMFKRAFSMHENSRQELIAKVMQDSSLDFNTKQQIVQELQRAPDYKLKQIASTPGVGFATGAGVGALIAKLLLGSGFMGTLFGAGLGGYIGNNLQNRYNSFLSPISSNPFHDNYSPQASASSSNPFIIL